VGNQAIASCSVDFTSDEKSYKSLSFMFAAVPTPVKSDNTPDSTYVGASTILGRNFTKGSILCPYWPRVRLRYSDSISVMALFMQIRTR